MLLPTCWTRGAWWSWRPWWSGKEGIYIKLKKTTHLWNIGYWKTWRCICYCLSPEVGMKLPGSPLSPLGPGEPTPEDSDIHIILWTAFCISSSAWILPGSPRGPLRPGGPCLPAPETYTFRFIYIYAYSSDKSTIFVLTLWTGFSRRPWRSGWTRWSSHTGKFCGWSIKYSFNYIQYFLKFTTDCWKTTYCWTHWQTLNSCWRRALLCLLYPLSLPFLLFLLVLP